MTATTAKKALYGITSFILGAWTFKKVNEISGPSFAPVIDACTNPDFTTMQEFVEETGYHEYEPALGLGVFKLLVCLITQFIFELRNTYPEGMLVWVGVMLSAMPSTLMIVMESGRRGVSKYSPIRYPILIGLLCQLFGVSVIVPLLWVPGYVWGCGYGPASNYRLNATPSQFVPAMVLTFIVFTADISSNLWTYAAGMLGGPILALSSFIFWIDEVPPLTTENLQYTANKIKSISKTVAFMGTIIWWYLICIAVQEYNSVEELYNRMWFESNSSVQFMVIDTLILYVAVVMWIAFHDEIMAIKAILLTPLLGFGGAPLVFFGAIEEMRAKNIDYAASKKNV